MNLLNVRSPFLAVIALTLIALAMGCSAPPPFVAEPEALTGQVDSSLSAELQQRQKAMRRFLVAMQEGAGDAGQLQLIAPGIDFQLPFDKFLGDSKRLAKWEFDGAPDGTQVAVKLYFDDQTGGPIQPDKLKQERRVYTVTVSGNQARISKGK